jgi:D-amino-acid dehydrogenase
MANRIIVIGGGVVGLSAAWALKKQGWTVTVVTEREPGYGASRIHAGWLIPGSADPVPAPGLVGTSMKWMASSSSPLYIQPRPSPELGRWLVEFWRHCNEEAYWRGVDAMHALGQRTWELFDEMHADGITFEEHRDGILYVYQSPADLDHEMELLTRFARNGLSYQGPIVGDELRAMEPALTDKIHGGVWLTQERSVRPDSVTNALVNWLENNGVELRRKVRVEGLNISGDRVTDVVFDHGRMETDAVLIAAGSWSPQIARYAKRRVPVQAGKGISLDYTPSPVEIRHPIKVHDYRHVITPLDGMTRVAGTMEFSGINEVIRPERVEAIVNGTTQTIRGWPTDLSRPIASTGLRPMSADGLPILGLLKGYKNLAIATGHGMLGLTLGPASVTAVADLLTNNGSRDILQPFDPARF